MNKRPVRGHRAETVSTHLHEQEAWSVEWLLTEVITHKINFVAFIIRVKIFLDLSHCTILHHTAGIVLIMLATCFPGSMTSQKLKSVTSSFVNVNVRIRFQHPTANHLKPKRKWVIV
jgi:hypothetical protein